MAAIVQQSLSVSNVRCQKFQRLIIDQVPGFELQGCGEPFQNVEARRPTPAEIFADILATHAHLIRQLSVREVTMCDRFSQLLAKFWFKYHFHVPHCHNGGLSFKPKLARVVFVHVQLKGKVMQIAVMKRVQFGGDTPPRTEAEILEDIELAEFSLQKQRAEEGIHAILTKQHLRYLDSLKLELSQSIALNNRNGVSEGS